MNCLIDLNEIDLFVDFESSGLGSESYPIEVGVKGTNIEYQTLIKPAPEWNYWNEESEKIHRINRESLQIEGMDLIEVCRDLNLLFSGKVLWSDNHCDLRWCKRLFSEADVKMAFKIQDIIEVLSDYKNSPHERAFYSSFRTSSAHRALSDATANKNAWLEFMNSLQVN